MERTQLRGWEIQNRANRTWRYISWVTGILAACALGWFAASYDLTEEQTLVLLMCFILGMVPPNIALLSIPKRTGPENLEDPSALASG